MRGWAAGSGRGVRLAVQAAADAAGAPALTAAAAAAALGKSRRSGAGAGGERGWTRREEPARSRCPQPGSLRESLSHGRRSAGPASEEEEEERGSGGAAGAGGEAAAGVALFHPQGFWSQLSSPVAAWGVPPLFGECSYPPGPTRAARPGSPERPGGLVGTVAPGRGGAGAPGEAGKERNGEVQDQGMGALTKWTRGLFAEDLD